MNDAGGRLLIVALGVLLWVAVPVRSLAEPLPAEVEAIRAERAAQRAALDRIRRKVEALRQAEEARASAERAPEPARPTEPARAAEPTEKEVEDRLFRLRVRRGAKTLLPWLAALYGAGVLFLLFAPYRLYIDYWLTHSGARRHPLLFCGSALCLLGAGWLLSQGGLESDPEMILVLGGAGGYCWFFIPGFLGFVLVFLHSLVVPHPMEATFKRVLQGEKLSREEAENLAAVMYNARRDGIPADWRVRNQIRRLERLATLLGRETAFLDLMSASVLHPPSERRRP